MFVQFCYYSFWRSSFHPLSKKDEYNTQIKTDKIFRTRSFLSSFLYSINTHTHYRTVVCSWQFEEGLFWTCSFRIFEDNHSSYLDKPSHIMHIHDCGIDLLYGELSDTEVKEGTCTEFGPGSINYEKNCKYNRDITNERGLINCLSRETSLYCNCMTPHKIEANKKLSETTTTTTTMDGRVTTVVPTVVKVGTCFGCQQEFPKQTLSFCTGCNIHKYCGKRCQIDNWPHHKVFCKMVQAANSSTSKGSNSANEN